MVITLTFTFRLLARSRYSGNFRGARPTFTGKTKSEAFHAGISEFFVRFYQHFNLICYGELVVILWSATLIFELKRWLCLELALVFRFQCTPLFYSAAKRLSHRLFGLLCTSLV